MTVRVTDADGRTHSYDVDDFETDPMFGVLEVGDPVVALFPAGQWIRAERVVEKEKTAPQPREWKSLTEVPPGLAVTDRDGDVWDLATLTITHRDGDISDIDPELDGHDSWGPFTEVLA